MSWMRQKCDVFTWCQYEARQHIRQKKPKSDWYGHLECLINKEIHKANIEVLLGFIEVIKIELPPLTACVLIETIHKLLKNKGYG